MNAQATTTVRVSRAYRAPAERVFDAWLNAKQAARFLFATPTGEMVRAEIDARVGGKFNFTERRDGDDIEHVGQYLEVERPRRLVFTFSVPKFSSDATRVTIETAPEDFGCRLSLTHAGVYAEYARRTEAGWARILEGLAAAL